MKYLTILLVLSLAMCAMANDFDEIRELQKLTGKAKVGGKVAAKGSVKAKVAAPKAKVNVKVPKVTGKVGVKAKPPAIKVKAGVTKPAAKAKIGGKVSLKVPKIKVKLHGKTKSTTPKVGGHMKIKLGASAKPSAGAKVTVKTQAKTTLEGTCPYAAKFGMTGVKAYEHTDKSVCKSLKSTCCEAKSMTTFATSFKTWTANLSKTLWTLLRIPAMTANVMGNLKLDKCVDQAQQEKDGKEKAATTAPTDAKKDAKKDDKKAPAAKDAKKDDKKAPAADAKKDDKKAPAADAKKDDKKAPAAADAKKAPAKRFRLLQAVNRRMQKPVAKVTAKPKAKVTVKAKPKAKVTIKGKAPAKPKAKVTIKGKAPAKPKAKVTIKGKAKKTKKVKLHLKLHGSAPKVSAKHSIKLKVSAKAPVWKASAEFANKVAPSEFLKGQKCQPAFMSFYQDLYNINWIRKETQFLGKKCFLALVRLRGELACASCDNTKEKYFNDPAKLAIKETDVQELGYCVALMGHFKQYELMLYHFMSLVRQLGGKAVGDLQRSTFDAADGPNYGAIDAKCNIIEPALVTDEKEKADPNSAKKADTKKDDAKKADTKKDDAKKADTKKDDAKKADTKKDDAKKADTKKDDTKKDDTKKPADTKKDDAKKDRILQQPVTPPAKEADKKPAEPAKKEDKKPADKKPEDKKPEDKKPEDKKPEDKKPEDKKPEDKKPAEPAKPAQWDLNKKTGSKDEDKSKWTSAMESWSTYINMEQKTVDEDKKYTVTKECLGRAWDVFFNPIIFGKADTKFEGLRDFKTFFTVLKYMNDNVAGPISNEVYSKMMGDAWGAKVKVSAKATGAKIKIHMKNAGDSIAAGAKKVGDFFKKAGNSVADGVKKAGASVAADVNKAAASLKGGVKLKVKAPKVSVKAGAKATPKAKVSVKAGAKATPKAKVGVKVGAKATPKAKVGVKVGAKTRRLQAANKPADKPAEKKEEKKDAKPVDTTMELTKDGLPVAEYSGDVAMPNPEELVGGPKQEAPATANLVKLCFMLFAALLTMY